MESSTARLFLVFAALVSLVSCATAADLQLELVSLVFRHGDRSPVMSYPGDKYDKHFWPQGFGQLSIKGMREQQYLGILLRDWYADTGFLNGNYSRDQFVMRSTDVDRTLMSAETQMSALFYPTPAQQFNATIFWQPVPVHTKPVDDDFMLRAFDNETCPEMGVLMELLQQTQEYKTVAAENEDLLKAVSGFMKTNITLQNVYTAYDTLFVQHSNNLSMPTWFNTSLLARMKTLEDYTLGLLFNTTQQKRLGGGLWAKTVIDNMMMKANGTLPDAKMFSYSAHDTTVTAMLSVFNMFNGVQPPYASAFIIELYRDVSSNKSFVKFLYRNDTYSDNRVVLNFQTCGELCPLDTVKEDMEQYFITEDEIKQRCGVTGTSSDSVGAPFYVLLVMAVLVFMFLITVIVVLAVLFNRMKQRYKNYVQITAHDNMCT